MKKGALDSELVNFVKTATPYFFKLRKTEIIKQSFVPSKKGASGIFPPNFWDRRRCFYERGFGQYANLKNESTFGAIGFFISDKQSIKHKHRAEILKILNALPRRKGFGYFDECRGQAGEHIFYGRVYFKKDFGKHFPQSEMKKDLTWLIQQTLPSFANL